MKRNLRDLLMRGVAGICFLDDEAGAGGAGGGDGGAAAGAGAGAAAAPWYTGADADLIGHIQNRGLHEKTPAEAALEFAKAHREAEKHIGVPADQLLRMPKDANDADGWGKVYDRLGVPKEAKDYDFAGVKTAAGTELGDDFAELLRGAGAKYHLTKDQVSGLARDLLEYGEKNETTGTAVDQAGVQQQQEGLKKDWATNYDANKFIAQQGAKALGVSNEEFAKMFETDGGARMLQMFHKVGVMAGEDKFITNGNNSGGKGGALTKEQAISTKNDLMQDFVFRSKFLLGDREAVNQMKSLDVIIAGETDANYERM